LSEVFSSKKAFGGAIPKAFFYSCKGWKLLLRFTERALEKFFNCLDAVFGELP
jgi:hypothetical protein